MLSAQNLYLSMVASCLEIANDFWAVFTIALGVGAASRVNVTPQTRTASLGCAAVTGWAAKLYGDWAKSECIETAKNVLDRNQTKAWRKMVKKIVEEKGGSVWLESDEGQGAKFIFTFPKVDNRL